MAIANGWWWCQQKNPPMAQANCNWSQFTDSIVLHAPFLDACKSDEKEG